MIIINKYGALFYRITTVVMKWNSTARAFKQMNRSISMQASPITVGFATGHTTDDKYLTRSYERTVSNAKSSIFSDSSRESDVPRTILISHDANSTGTRINSLMSLRTVEEDSNNPGTYGNLDIQIKVSRDVAVFDKAAVELEIAFACFLLSRIDASEWNVLDDTAGYQLAGPATDFIDRFLNQEH